MYLQLCSRLGVLLVLSSHACSHLKEGAARDAAPAASAGAGAVGSAFVWPLGSLPDAAVPVAPRKGMIWISAGTLIAGTLKEKTPRIADEELPGQPVELHGFYIDEFAYPNEVGAIPKTGMTRDEASALCAAQDKRLCTELEWERACKGIANTTYEYGETYRASECVMGLPGRLAPSGLRVACKSAFGVHDMHGGPWEWTSSVWRRGGPQVATLRGGNSEAGELVGRCANAMAVSPGARRPDLATRCCAGEANAAEVKLTVVRGKTLEPRHPDTAFSASLAQILRENPPPELPSGEPFRVDRTWLWHPVGNEELVIAAGCARRVPHMACGVGVFRMRPASAEPGAKETPVLVGFASSGWWMAVVRTDYGNRDLWVFGGDGVATFKRRVAYVWGRVALGEAERSSPRDLQR